MLRRYLPRRKILTHPRRFPYAPFSEMLTNRYPRSIQWQNVKGIIGDLGDTIVSGQPMIESLQKAFFQTLQIQVSKEILEKDFGAPKSQQVQNVLCLPSSRMQLKRAPTYLDVDRVVNQFEDNLCEFYEIHGVQYLPNTFNAIRTFHRQGILFGCTTGLSQRVIDTMEKKLPLWRPWPIVHCERPSPSGVYEILGKWNRGKPKSKHTLIWQCIKIGDSKADLQEAKEANVAFIAVTGHRAVHFGMSKTQHNDLENEFLLSGTVKVVRNLDELGAMICPWMKHGLQ